MVLQMMPSIQLLFKPSMLQSETQGVLLQLPRDTWKDVECVIKNVIRI